MSLRLLKTEKEYCLLCHESGGVVCGACMADLATGFNFADEVCPLCATESVKGALCGRCQKTPPPYDHFWASVRYEMPLTGMLHEWKHLGRSEYAAAFAHLMIANLPIWLDDYRDGHLLAMPLSRERRLYRGFNQCDELVHYLSVFLQMPALSHNTVFRQHCPPQSTLGAEERRKNVRKIFQVRQSVENCKIVLIDDVRTTGATLAELAQTLKKSGAAQVAVWTATSNKMQKI